MYIRHYLQLQIELNPQTAMDKEFKVFASEEHIITLIY